MTLIRDVTQITSFMLFLTVPNLFSNKHKVSIRLIDGFFMVFKSGYMFPCYNRKKLISNVDKALFSFFEFKNIKETEEK